jgi:hypothetical protein
MASRFRKILMRALVGKGFGDLGACGATHILAFQKYDD